MATHSSVLAWRIPGTESLVGCCLWGRTESDTTVPATEQIGITNCDIMLLVKSNSRFGDCFLPLHSKHKIFLVHDVDIGKNSLGSLVRERIWA